MNIAMLSGPVIGAIIGYGTNWIAIKMLFRPFNPIKIGKFILPFTPGIIPKRKEKMAKAVGDSIGNNLFTSNDIKQVLLSEETTNMIVNKIMEGLNSEETIKNILLGVVEEEKYSYAKENIKLLISEKIRDGLINCSLGQIIANEGKSVISKKVNGTMLKMFVNDELISSIADPMGAEVDKYIREHGQEYIIPQVDNEIAKFEKLSLKELINDIHFEEENLKNTIREIYNNFVNNYIDNLIQKIDISGIVENKINEMDMKELEKLILSIMKKELGAVVNLGAFIGLILGTINIFI